ncbi:hypothetical protein PFISCL1PPCAC_17977, partial [Pristionchus fissidentatus]
QSFTWAEWKRPMIVVILTFLCNVESTMLGIGEWSYMSTIDHETTSSFFAFSTALNKAGNAIFALVFAVWAHKISGIRIPMIAGRCITLVACIMYIFIEFIPSNRRYWTMTVHFLFGVGSGTSPLLRSYIARTTSDENRSTAYALQIGAAVLSAIIAPIAQISFSGLPYPGVTIIEPNIKLNIYTAPIYFAVITNIVAIVLAIVSLEDPKDEFSVKSVSSNSFTFSSIRNRLSNIRSLNLPWILIILVIFEKVVSQLSMGAMGSISGPMFTAMYALTGEETVLVMGISQLLVGVIVLVLTSMFFICKLGKRVSCRILFVISNIFAVLSYLITYPFPFSSNPMQPFNETTRVGCNPQEYPWCDTQLVVNIILFLITLIVTNSFAIPSGNMSLDTIYSKMIGNIDQ